MLKTYHLPRSSSWNFGGTNWKLSRSKIDLFLECPRCFYLDNKLGLKRPPGFPFNLNKAVDTLLKKEFDLHRAKNKKHPLQEKYGIDAVPAVREELDTWRENFIGIQYFHKPTGMTVTGAIDDLWINKKKKYVVVDYKATSKETVIDKLNEDWHEGYKRQMEVYQWLLRQKGLKVSRTGYFVYCNGLADKKAFDGRLEFDITLIDYLGSTTWVEPTLFKIKECLESKKIPKADHECDYCKWAKARRRCEK